MHSFVCINALLWLCRISKAMLNDYSEKIEAIASKLVNHVVCICYSFLSISQLFCLWAHNTFSLWIITFVQNHFNLLTLSSFSHLINQTFRIYYTMEKIILHSLYFQQSQQNKAIKCNTFHMLQ